MMYLSYGEKRVLKLSVGALQLRMGAAINWLWVQLEQRLTFKIYINQRLPPPSQFCRLCFNLL